jgi:hypothetical protein
MGYPPQHRKLPSRPQRSGTTGLATQPPPKRLAALLRENASLRTKIGTKKKAVAKQVELLNEITRAMSVSHSLLLEHQAMQQELHALFAELLARKRQPRGARTVVKMVFSTLLSTGLLWPTAADVDDESDDFDDSWDEDDDVVFVDGFGPRKQAEDLPSNRPASDAPERQSARDLFRRLAMAVHPDKVQQAEEKERRTEAMKDISRAYEDGDVARLLDLERQWMRDGKLDAQGDDLERRCAALAQTNAALEIQYSDLLDELYAMKHLPQMLMYNEYKRAAVGTGVDFETTIKNEATEELDQVRIIRDFVKSFRDGKIGLQEFEMGPRELEERASVTKDDVTDIEDVLEDILGLFSGGRGKAGRQGGRHKRSGRRK